MPTLSLHKETKLKLFHRLGPASFIISVFLAFGGGELSPTMSQLSAFLKQCPISWSQHFRELALVRAFGFDPPKFLYIESNGLLAFYRVKRLKRQQAPLLTVFGV